MPRKAQNRRAIPPRRCSTCVAPCRRVRAVDGLRVDRCVRPGPFRWQARPSHGILDRPRLGTPEVELRAARPLRVGPRVLRPSRTRCACCPGGARLTCRLTSSSCTTGRWCWPIGRSAGGQPRCGPRPGPSRASPRGEVAPELPTLDEALEQLGPSERSHPGRPEGSGRGGGRRAIRRHGLIDRSVVSTSTCRAFAPGRVDPAPRGPVPGRPADLRIPRARRLGRRPRPRARRGASPLSTGRAPRRRCPPLVVSPAAVAGAPTPRGGGVGRRSTTNCSERMLAAG